MNPAACLKTFIYLVSSSLLYPVLALLCLLVLWVVVYSGSFFSEWLERCRREKTGRDDLADRILSGSVENLPPRPLRAFLRRLEPLLTAETGRDARVESLLQETELEWMQGLDRLKLLIRIGPGLGLIGTLIPMGTGLASLGQGDMTRLSAGLVIAFTTTVVGLALGLAAYAFYTVKRRWLLEDLRVITLAAELLAAGRGEEE